MSVFAKWVIESFLKFKNDVWDDPTIEPVTAFLLSALVGLVVWLTLTFAPGAVNHEALGAGDSISPAWGRITIAIVTTITFAVGFEPVLTRFFERWWRWSGRRNYDRLWAPVRLACFVVGSLLVSFPKLLSLVWSLADYLLARPIAVLAGISWPSWQKRYLHFFTLIVFLSGLAILGPTELGPLNIAVALAMVLAVVRRWTWIEADRYTFLIERGERKSGRGGGRVGFKVDLRDEALIALICLFFLIPIGLDLVQQRSCAAGINKCAFVTESESVMPQDTFNRFITWLGYFGVELAKTVPFVDWSEVFHVANGSPIKANTVLGSQVAFVLRAGLDLLFLATVLQGIQIATRLRGQESAFRSNRLPILEPFTEKVELGRAFEQINEDLDLPPSAQAAILDFPRYDAARLKELIDGTAETKDLNVRMASAVLLQKDFDAAPDNNPDTLRFWTDRAKTESEAGYRGWLLHIASGVDSDEPLRMKDAARRTRLLRLIEEDRHDSGARAQAARQLGRLGLSASECGVLLRCLTADQDLMVQAAAAVALAKSQVEEAFPAIEALVGRAPEAAVVPSQTLAYALAHRGGPAEEIVSGFVKALRPHALAAALIQRAPMEIEAGKRAEKFATNYQTVALAPGQGPFPDHILMGSADDDSEAFNQEQPRRRVAMTRPFVLGRFPVTMAEYSIFSAATGRPGLQYAANKNWPAIEVSWFDAKALCKWLQAITGESWRMPCESEWEYACRAGTTSAYSWGPDWDTSKANSNQTQPNNPRDVDCYSPNDWGIWDMHGNVLEWCIDPWHENYSGAPDEGNNWLEDGDFTMRVARGGSWRNFPQQLRSAVRYRNSPTIRYTNFGFRLARTLV